MKLWTTARLLKQREPYHFQRQWHQNSKYPRPAQPNTYQPNQTWAPGVPTGKNYYDMVFKDYLKKRQGGSQFTNLALGRL